MALFGSKKGSKKYLSWLSKQEKPTDSKQQSNNRQVKSLDSIMVSPIMMKRLYMRLEIDEYNDIRDASYLGYKKSFTNTSDQGNIFVNLMYLNSTGKQFM